MKDYQSLLTMKRRIFDNYFELFAMRLKHTPFMSFEADPRFGLLSRRHAILVYPLPARLYYHGDIILKRLAVYTRS